MKYASKIPETLRKLPRQNLNILEVISDMYEDFGDDGIDRKVTYHDLYEQVLKRGRARHWQRI